MDVVERVKKDIVIHLTWVTFILLASVIFLFSIKIGTDGQVKDIINTSLSVSSLMLALVAIVQAIISGGGLNSAITMLKAEVSQLQSPSEKILIAATALTSYSEELNKSARSIDDKISSMSLNVKSEDIKTEDSSAQFFTRQTTIGGNIALYLCATAKEQELEFDPSKIFDD